MFQFLTRRSIKAAVKRPVQTRVQQRSFSGSAKLFQEENKHIGTALPASGYGGYKVSDEVSFPEEEVKHYKKYGSSDANRAFTYFMVGTASMGYATAIKNGALDLLSTLNPPADVLALANVEVDLSTISEGTTATLKYRGKPLFVRHRTAEEIEEARSIPLSELRDQEADEQRTQKPEWVIVLGVCTHLGCVPISNSGDWKGWYCPCHGSHYDNSGRIMKGPAPLNLEIPDYTFVSEDKVIVGMKADA